MGSSPSADIHEEGVVEVLSPFSGYESLLLALQRLRSESSQMPCRNPEWLAKLTASVPHLLSLKNNLMRLAGYMRERVARIIIAQVEHCTEMGAEQSPRMSCFMGASRMA
jgi:hypothetical protein